MKQNFKEILNEVELLMASISDPKAIKALNKLLNLIEMIHHENEELIEANQQLKDEISHLKGEQGKPKVKGNKRKNNDISSEKERKNGSADDEDDPENSKKKKRQRQPKLPQIKIDREQICQVDKSDLPKDIQFKGYSDVVIQDIKIVTDNVKYRREIYYSPSQRKTYLGDLPSDVAGKGEYGVGVRSLIPLLKSECNFEIPDDLVAVYKHAGLDIEAFNGKGRNVLPVPGSFVIDTNGIVRATQARTDYKLRMEPETIIDALMKISADN
jgi:hypothetical protein